MELEQSPIYFKNIFRFYLNKYQFIIIKSIQFQKKTQKIYKKFSKIIFFLLFRCFRRCPSPKCSLKNLNLKELTLLTADN